MSKTVHIDVMDAAFDEVIDNATALHVCSGDPADRAAVLTNSLATASLTPGDFTKAAGDVSGRKNTVAQQAELPIDSDGSAATVAIIDGTRMLKKTDIADGPVPLTEGDGNQVTVNAFAHEIRDPE